MKRYGALVLGLALAGCDGTTEPSRDVNVTLHVSFNGIAIATVVVEVTAEDIPTPLAFNLDVVEGSASGTISVPAGSARTVTVRAYDAGGIETHRGSVTLDVHEGENPSATITIEPLVGDVPIVVTVGTLTVTVEPATGTLAVGDTLRLRVFVVDGNDDTLDVRVSWATLNPALAVVDTAGLVTALGAGSVTVVAVYAGVGGAATVTVAQALAWAALPSMPQVAGAGVAATLGGRVYVLGGGPAGVLTTQTQVYDTTAGTWSEGPAFTGARAFAAAGALGGLVHLVGGVSQETDHQAFDPATSMWSARAPLPVGVRAATAEIVGGKLYVIGGVSSTAGLSDAVQVYDPAGNSWSSGAAMPTPRMSAASAVLGGKVYVAGGETAGVTTTDVLEVYDPAADMWETLAPMPGLREALGGGAIGGEFCVFGGRLANASPTGDAFPETFCYDPNANMWRQGPDMLTPRVTVASVELAGVVYALGGRAGDENLATAEVLRR